MSSLSLCVCLPPPQTFLAILRSRHHHPASPGWKRCRELQAAAAAVKGGSRAGGRRAEAAPEGHRFPALPRILGSPGLVAPLRPGGVEPLPSKGPSRRGRRSAPAEPGVVLMEAGGGERAAFQHSGPWPGPELEAVEKSYSPGLGMFTEKEAG